jgi:hypothetical protein
MNEFEIKNICNKIILGEIEFQNQLISIIDI